MFFFFKQKTAYEMLRSLVGSEMCIRDSWYGRGAADCKGNLAMHLEALRLVEAAGGLVLVGQLRGGVRGVKRDQFGQVGEDACAVRCEFTHGGDATIGETVGVDKQMVLALAGGEC